MKQTERWLERAELAESVEEHEDVGAGRPDSTAEIRVKPTGRCGPGHGQFEFRHEVRQASAGVVGRCRLVHNRTVLAQPWSQSAAVTDELGVGRLTG